MINHYLVVDDEPLARSRLIRLIKEIDSSGTFDEARDGFEALKAIQEKNLYKAIFLDIEMPGLTGFDVARKLHPAGHDIPIVFCTAYAKYAAAAFTEDALDYLVKPVELERLRLCLARCDRRSLSKEQLERAERGYLPPLLFKVGDKNIPINRQDIISFEADRKMTKVKTLDREFLVSESLDELEITLKDETFYRSHRSSLINVRHIIEIQSEVIAMRKNIKQPISRRRRANLLEIFDKLS